MAAESPTDSNHERQGQENGDELPPLPPRQPFYERPQQWMRLPEQDMVDNVSDRKSKDEPKKWAFIHDTERCTVQFVWFQIPAIAGTLTLLAFHILRYFWNPTSNDLGALLFASKVHESLIIASLFHILYYHIRRGLLTSRGVPFGYITSAFQLNSPFYLFSSSFLAPLTRYRPTTWSSAMLGVLLVLTFFIAALAGACSSIVMLPRLGWWDMSLKQMNSSVLLHAGSTWDAFIAKSAADLYPLNIDLASVPKDCSDHNSNRTVVDCPYDDFADPDGLAWNSIDSLAGIASAGSWPVNLTILPSNARSVVVNIFGDYLVDGVAATSPVDAISLLLRFDGDRWKSNPVKMSARVADQQGNALPVKQPRVVIQCSDDAWPRINPTPGETNSTAPYSFSSVPFFYPKAKFTVPRDVLKSAYQSNETFGFLDLNQYLPVRTSATFWTRYNTTGTSLALCFVDARWVEADTWYLPSTSGNMVQHSVRFTNETLKYADSANPDGIISLDLAWLNMLNATTLKMHNNGRWQMDKTSFIFDLFKGTLDDGVANSLAVFLTSALANVPSSRGWRATAKSPAGPWQMDRQPQNITDPEGLPDGKYVAVSAAYYQYVYQYNFEGTTTKLAWAVLLLHVLLVVIHLMTLCIYGRWNTAAWGQLAELMTLAMNTRPTELLKNTGAGVDRWKTWRLTAFVREVEGESAVQLVVTDQSDVSKEVEDLGSSPTSFRKYG